MVKSPKTPIGRRILITGGTGMIGASFNGVETHHEVLLAGREQANLLDNSQFIRLLQQEKPDAVIHLAAKVGGIKANTDYIADFYTQNIRINCNVLDACHYCGIEKVVSLLSTCVYPDASFVSYPLTEEQLHYGPPHASNFAYAHAKRMLDVQSRAYRQQFGCNFITAIPNNLYGPHDNYDLENSHVIPAIIRKVYEAKQTGTPPIFWGDGESLREFTFSQDISKALLFLLENYNDPTPINIGNTKEYSIEDIVKMICTLMKYDGEVMWDRKKPKGQYRKPSCNKNFIDLGWKEEYYTELEEGLLQTIKHFVDNYPNLRGIS